MPRELKVLIAEDELLIRMGIKLSCNWEQLNMRVVADVSSGLEAYDEYLRLKPDILLLDVRMPGLSGIEVAEKIRKTDRSTRIIAVTCVDQFETLHQLSHFGITDYLLKADMTPDVLEGALRKAREEWECMHPDSITNADVSEEEDTLASVPGMNAIVLYSPAFTDKAPPMVLQTLRQMIHEQFPYFVKLSLDQPGRVTCRTVADRSVPFEEKLKLIQTHFKRIFTQPLSLLSAEININESFLSCIERVHTLYDSGYWCQEDTVRHEPDEAWLSSLKESVKTVLNAPSLSANIPQNAYNALSEQLPKLPTDSISAWKDAIVSLTMYIMLHVLRLPPTSVTSVSSSLLAAPTAHASVEMCLHLIEHQIYQNLELRVRRPEIRQALEFINSNFDRSISTTDAALHVGLSPHHFSNLFKRETGMTFVGYLNHYRIERAKMMLEDTSMYAYEIASRCGFSDAAYFSRIFKQVTGVHPSHYRKSGEGESV